MALRTLAVDFDSFFASCEQQERPELRGKAVAVVPSTNDTATCVAASYPAKACGVRAGVGVAEARRLCPDIVFVEQRPRLYNDYRRRLLETIERCIHVSAVHSTEVVTCDLPAPSASKERALRVARRIKRAVAKELGPALSCSIGIAPNRMIARLATGMRKPDGLVVIDESDLPQPLLVLKVTDIIGVGSDAEARLRSAGITTAEHLYKASREQLRDICGSAVGGRIYESIRGRETPAAAVSSRAIGRSLALPPEARTSAAALAALHELLREAVTHLRSVNHCSGSLGLSLDYLDDCSWGDDLRLADTQDLERLTTGLLFLWARSPGPIRTSAPFRVGLSLARLRPLPRAKDAA